MNLFGLGKPELIVIPDLHLRLVREGKRLRVNPNSNNYLFLETSPEKFLSLYREVLSMVPFRSGSTICDEERIEFSHEELLEATQEVILALMHTHIHHHVPPRITPEEMEHPNVWRIVLRKAEAKYGAGSDRAIALAAYTLNMPLEQFATWVRVEAERESLM